MSDFDWEIFAKKGIKKFFLGALLGGVGELMAFFGTEPVPTEYLWVTALVVLVLEQVLNGLKHKLL